MADKKPEKGKEADKKVEKGKDAKDGKKEEGKPENPDKIAKKRKLILVGGILAVLLAAGGGGAFFVMKTLAARGGGGDHGQPVAAASPGAGEKGHAAGEEKGKAEAGKEKKPEGDAHGEKAPDGHGEKGVATAGKGDAAGLFAKARTIGDMFQIPKMELNLGNPLENRFLRLAVSIEYMGEKEQEDELNKRQPQIRDIIIRIANSKTRMDLLASGGKDKMRREILNEINQISEKPVKAIYFTEFLVE